MGFTQTKRKTTEPFLKFIEPKRRATVPRKPKNEKVWDEIVKADGKGMKEVRLKLYNWRQLGVARTLAKFKTGDETREREKLELVRWEQEIKKEEARRSTKERKAFEESPCDPSVPSVSEDESEDEPSVSEDESLFKIKFESESYSD